jgi:hypothetical protein
MAVPPRAIIKVSPDLHIIEHFKIDRLTNPGIG